MIGSVITVSPGAPIIRLASAWLNVVASVVVVAMSARCRDTPQLRIENSPYSRSHFKLAMLDDWDGSEDPTRRRGSDGSREDDFVPCPPCRALDTMNPEERFV